MKEIISKYKKQLIMIAIVFCASLFGVGAKAVYNSLDELSDEEIKVLVAEAEEKVAKAELKTLLAKIDALNKGEGMDIGTTITYNPQMDSFIDGSDRYQNIQAMAEQMANLQEGDILQVNASGYMVAVSSTAIEGSGGTESWDFTTTTADYFEVDGVVSTTASEATTYTLTEADLWYNNYFSVTLGSESGLTYTLPNSSTITNLIPNAGDRRTWYFDNVTTTAGSDLIFTTGVGTYPIYASSTERITASSTGQVTFVRRNNTDIIVEIQDFSDL